MTIVSQLAEFAATLGWEDVPKAIGDKLEDHVLDTLGVMCAGKAAPASAAAARTLARWQGTPECAVVGTNLRLPAPHAAFLNAFHGRIHTFDDTIEAGPVHPGSVVVAAALASAEACGASGPTLLASALAGYEIVARIVAALGPSHYAMGFHTTGTCNVFGAAAAAGRARGLDAHAVAGALGIAGGMASGLRQYQLDGSISDSALNGAHAAFAGVFAAELAAAGMAGPSGIIDGKFGLGTIMTQAADFALAASGLGRHFLFAGTAIKPYPTCRFTHGPLDELAKLQRKLGFAAADVVGIEIATFRQSIEVSDKATAASRTDALLSHQFSAALLLTRGSLDLSALDSGAYREPGVIGLAARIRVVHDPELERLFPASWPHRVNVALRDGRNLEALSLNPPGGGDDPLPRSAVAAKFRANAAPVLGAAGAEELAAVVSKLELAPDLSVIARLAHPRPARAHATTPSVSVSAAGS